MRLSVAAAISHGRLYRRLGSGPRSRVDLLRNLVTALVRHERLEAPWARADEMRGYAERVRGRDGAGGAHTGRYRAITGAASPQLIDYAKRGDTDERAMRMANFWLTVGTPLHPLPPRSPHPLRVPPGPFCVPPQSQS